MRLFFALLMLTLIVACTGQEAKEVSEEVSSEMPVSGADVEETAVTEEAAETEDLTTSEDTFDALDEAMEELE